MPHSLTFHESTRHLPFIPLLCFLSVSFIFFSNTRKFYLLEKGCASLTYMDALSTILILFLKK